MSSDTVLTPSGSEGGSGSSLSSSVATTTTSIFDEFNSLDDQDAPAVVLTAAKALRVDIHTTTGDEHGAGPVLSQFVIRKRGEGEEKPRKKKSFGGGRDETYD